MMGVSKRAGRQGPKSAFFAVSLATSTKISRKALATSFPAPMRNCFHLAVATGLRGPSVIIAGRSALSSSFSLADAGAISTVVAIGRRWGIGHEVNNSWDIVPTMHACGARRTPPDRRSPALLTEVRVEFRPALDRTIDPLPVAANQASVVRATHRVILASQENCIHGKSSQTVPPSDPLKFPMKRHRSIRRGQSREYG